MPELVFILEASRDAEYNKQKFAAAMQGVDLDEQTGKSKKNKANAEGKKPSTFEDIQARVFSGGMAQDANDILALQGSYGARKGFQIGKEMNYGKVHHKDPNAPKNPFG